MLLPWLKPQPLGLATSFGFGDRLGLASPGHIAAVKSSGIIRAYTGEGELTNDPSDTFGHRAVVYTPNLQKLLAYLCKYGFEHHVAMTISHVAPVLTEAFSNYVKWDVYHHQ